MRKPTYSKFILETFYFHCSSVLQCNETAVHVHQNFNQTTMIMLLSFHFSNICQQMLHQLIIEISLFCLNKLQGEWFEFEKERNHLWHKSILLSWIKQIVLEQILGKKKKNKWKPAACIRVHKLQKSSFDSRMVIGACVMALFIMVSLQVT